MATEDTLIFPLPFSFVQPTNCTTEGRPTDCGVVFPDKQQSYSRINNIFLELRKCCNHPYLLKGVEADNTALRGAKPEAVVDAMVEASGKLALIDKMFSRLKELGHRTLIYSQFTTVLDILEDWLEHRGWGFQRIDGEVSESLSIHGMPCCCVSSLFLPSSLDTSGAKVLFFQCCVHSCSVPEWPPRRAHLSAKDSPGICWGLLWVKGQTWYFSRRRSNHIIPATSG
jgi:hypothetical protein